MNYYSLARHIIEILLLAQSAGAFSPVAAGAQDVGESAPAFVLPATTGEEIALETYRGQYVVLEWMNFRCRSVDRLYKSRHMPALQDAFRNEGGVWLSIISEAEGRQGQTEVSRIRRQVEKRGGQQNAVLLDVSGEVALKYGASMSPFMVLIDPSGKVLYQGALDNQPEGEPLDGEPILNYVIAAHDQARAGESVRFPVTEAYGCPIRSER